MAWGFFHGSLELEHFFYLLSSPYCSGWIKTWRLMCWLVVLAKSLNGFCRFLLFWPFIRFLWEECSNVHPSALLAGEIAAHIHQARSAYIKYKSLKDAWEDYQKQIVRHSVHWHAENKIKHFILRKKVFRSGDKIRIVGQVYMCKPLFIHDNIYWTNTERYPTKKYDTNLHPGGKHIPFECSRRLSCDERIQKVWG